MAIGNINNNLVKIGCVVREICSRTDKHTQTLRQTDMFITILLSASPTVGGDSE